MAYTALATKTDGDTLTASHMNAVAGNIEFLYGLVQAPNIGFASYAATLTSQSPQYWAFIHQHRYIHYEVVVTGTGDAIAIDAGTDGSTFGNSVMSDGSSPTGTYTDYADTSGWGLTVGDPLYVRATWNMGTASLIRINYLIESDSTTL